MCITFEDQPQENFATKNLFELNLKHAAKINMQVYLSFSAPIK